MTYPADIVRAVADVPSLAARFRWVRPFADRELTAAHDAEFDRWLATREAQQLRPVARYVHYVRTMDASIESARRLFDATNRQSGNEFWARSTGRYELLHVTALLYLVDSWGVQGAVLECGAFTGFSSVVLSRACELLGRRLLVADSFEGIPDLGQGDKNVFAPGRYACAEDVVLDNLAALGSPRTATLVKGWFSESLTSIDQPLAMVWMDVDLEQSVVDVLDHTLDRLSPGAAICCHEFLPSSIDHGRIVATEHSPYGLRRSLESRGLGYVAQHLTGYTACVHLDRDLGARPPYQPELLDRMLALTNPAERGKSLVRAAVAQTTLLHRDAPLGRVVRRLVKHTTPLAIRDVDISPRTWR